jgi:IS30 family transposase
MTEARRPRDRDRPTSKRDDQIERLRRQRLTGDRIARQLGVPRSTVGAVLRDWDWGD